MSSVDPAVQDVSIAIRHARLRWVGAPLLVTGVLLVLTATLSALSGGNGWNVMLSMFGTGTALASFGANHDTAMAHALRVRTDTRLPVDLKHEVEQELARNRNDTLGLRPSAGAGMVVPLVAIAAQAWLLWRLLGI